MSDTIQDWSDLFLKEGDALAVAGNRPLALSDPLSAWIVSAGPIDLFAVPLRNGEPSGARIHLCRIEQGHLLFGVPAGAVGLIAVGLPGTTVHRLPLSRLQEWAAEPSAAGPLCALVEHWTERLTEGAARGRMPRNAKLLQAGQETPLDGPAAVAPASGVLWVSSERGAARFLDLCDVSLQTPYPVPGGGWLSVAEKICLQVRSTESLLHGGLLWPGLVHFNQTLVACAAAEAQEMAAAESARLQAKQAAEGGAIQGALVQLASVVESEMGPRDLGDVAAVPLLAACRLVGSALGINIRSPRNLGEPSAAEPLAIARASGVRTRRVVLAGDWWRGDHGPLLAFASADNRPLALMPVTRSRYVAVDPATQQRTAVTAETAGRLKSHAYVFYPPFPGGRISVRDLVRFSLAGTARDWISVLVLGLACGLIGLLAPLATGLIFGRLVPFAQSGQLLVVVMALTASIVASVLFEYAQGIAVLRLETRMHSAVEAGLWDRLLNLPASFFRQFAAGDLADRAMGVGRIRQVLTQAAMSTVLSFVFSLVSFALLLAFDVGLAMLAIGLFLLIIGVTALAAWVQLQFERQSHAVHGKVVGIVLQLLSGISRLRVAAAENRALAFWARHFSQKTRLAYRAQSVANALATFSAAVPVLCSLAIFAAVGLRAEPIGLGLFLAFNAALVQIVLAAVMMSGTISTLLEIVPLCERARPILQTLPESHRLQRDPGELTGDVEISHVSFRYHPDGPLVLDDVTIAVRPGQFVALVGPSGAGKSTILRLLLGFETPTSGSVYYDRKDLLGLDLQAVRRQMGVVLQGNRLTPGDLFTNITGGAPQYTLDDAWEAARQSGLEADIRRMPMGMFTVVSEAEGTLSGGQRQRLMIARAIVSRPRILLFDEATSALDQHGDGRRSDLRRRSWEDRPTRRLWRTDAPAWTVCRPGPAPNGVRACLRARACLTCSDKHNRRSYQPEAQARAA